MFYSECVPLEEVPRTSRGSWAWNPDSRFPFPVSQKTHSWFVVVRSWHRGRSGIRFISYLLKHAVFLGFLISCHPALIQVTASRIWIPVSKYRKTGTFCIFVSGPAQRGYSSRKCRFSGLFQTSRRCVKKQCPETRSHWGALSVRGQLTKKQAQPVEFYWQLTLAWYSGVVILTLTFII